MLLCYLIPSTLVFTSQKDDAAPIFPGKLENRVCLHRKVTVLTNSYLLPLNLTEDHHFSFSVLNSNKWVSFGYR